MMTAHRVALIDMVSMGQIKEVNKLIDGGCDVNEKNYEGHCAVMAAVQRNSPDILAVLIKAGASVDIKDGEGRSALLYAQMGGYDKVANLIAKKLQEKEPVANTKIPVKSEEKLKDSPEKKEEASAVNGKAAMASPGAAAKSFFSIFSTFHKEKPVVEAKEIDNSPKITPPAA